MVRNIRFSGAEWSVLFYCSKYFVGSTLTVSAEALVHLETKLDDVRVRDKVEAARHRHPYGRTDTLHLAESDSEIVPALLEALLRIADMTSVPVLSA